MIPVEEKQSEGLVTAPVLIFGVGLMVTGTLPATDGQLVCVEVAITL